MTRRYATQLEILRAIRDRLILKLDAYTDANCVILDQPVPEDVPVGREFCTVSPGNGTFPQQLFAGAGEATCTEDASIVVTPLIRNVRDRPRRAEEKLLSAADGLTERKWQILRALLAEDWDPTVIPATGYPRYLLREQLAPLSAAAPGQVKVGQYEMIGMQITFAAPFDWGLEPI